MGSPRELIDRLPLVETLTPSALGPRLFAAFEGYNTHGLPPYQVRFLLKNYLLYSTGDGNPVCKIDSPRRGDPVLPWQNVNTVSRWGDPATTNRHTADAPHIIPADFQNVFKIITVTDSHHFWKSRREEHDIVISQSGQTLIPYWYIKGERPIKPQHMIDLASISSDPLWEKRPDGFGAFIQLWQFLPCVNTYQLQAALKLNEISLKDFFHVMGAQPSELQKIEAAAQVRR